MDTCFDIGLGTGMVALALNTAFGTGVYHLKGFCTGVDTCAVLALTRIKAPRRARALAWQLGPHWLATLLSTLLWALASTTGGVSALASILVLYWL
ncbi:uncharacterized protein EV154DRAFT_500582 [Mucor mucedo]|uniref:uncharacterized protein n=1 Tax=Mucor mucedo TaxID=29922 RepID=UPI00221EEBF4|nr:uncharacterized protein EV154DRAFT_500582 [Mucor mucedo]KAI7893726.1 hypothetical protein EV154DRAFT_500582 [Mucor mucedo]